MRRAASALVALLLLFATAPASAIYKCESNAGTSYSDLPCPGGQRLTIDAAAASADDNSDNSDGKRRLAREKAELKQLQATRHKQEAAARKQQQKARKAYEAKRKKCATLALRLKWAREDAADAGLKKAAGARRKARRAEQAYQAACG